MARISKRKITKWLLAGVGAYAAFLILCHLYWLLAAFGSSPEMVSDIENRFRKLPSKVLISKLRGYDNPLHIDYLSPYPYSALYVLVERKEKAATPEIIKFLTSWDKNRRQEAMRALGKINDPRAIEPLMRIVNKSKIDPSTYDYNKSGSPDYVGALTALSLMKYEKIYLTTVSIAALKKENDPYDFRSCGIDMLEYFEKPESIPILEKISREDPEAYIRDKAKKAIEHIKSLQLQTK